ncbi:ABC transporter ATP-binding protein [Rhizobium sp. RCC_161_2]|uniref:ABC transporter ATP-binding protein n=1 Tax=Rhizobium sp. RCC_161_2 TaxID=3239219 RepID=UPI0035268DE4
MLNLDTVSVTFNPGTALEVAALRSVSLAIPEGQFVTVIGSNGAGKSTLLSAIAGAIMPNRGRIVIDGVDVTRLPTQARARFIGRVFQDPRVGTCEVLTVEENLALADARSGRRGFSLALGGRANRARFEEQLAGLGLGLETKLKARIGTLSGGQRQAVSLLMATLLPMKLLLLDEHTAALDPKAAARILTLSAEISESQRLTTLMVTHSMRHALDHGQRTVMMSGGRIVLDVAGETRAGYNVADLIALFGAASGSEVAEDRLLLG